MFRSRVPEFALASDRTVAVLVEHRIIDTRKRFVPAIDAGSLVARETRIRQIGRRLLQALASERAGRDVGRERSMASSACW